MENDKNYGKIDHVYNCKRWRNRFCTANSDISEHLGVRALNNCDNVDCNNYNANTGGKKNLTWHVRNRSCSTESYKYNKPPYSVLETDMIIIITMNNSYDYSSVSEPETSYGLLFCCY